MARRLKVNVIVTASHEEDPNGFAVFGPDDDVPEWAAGKIGDHAWDDDSDADDGAGDGAEPPRSGKGSGREAWAQFAAANGVDVDDDASRDDIVTQLADAGIVEK